MPRVEHVFAAGTRERIRISAPEDFRPPKQIEIERAGRTIIFTPIDTVKRTRDVKAGTRIRPDYAPSDELRASAAEFAPSVNLEGETGAFVDWFTAAPGSKGVKLDWDAAWRVWMRTAHRRNVERGWKSKPTRAPVTSITHDAAKARWLSDHGVSEAEWAARSHDPEWVAMIERRGIVR